MIQIGDVIEIVVSNMAEFRASGNMSREGASFFDTEFEIRVEYNIVEVPYIIYQELGFVHWRSGKLVNPNAGFINVKAKNKLKMYVYNDTLGMSYNNLEDTQISIEAQGDILCEIGANIDV